MNDTIGNMSNVFDEEDYDDLGAGIASSFPVISYRQSKWRIRWQGMEAILSDPPNGRVPVPEIGVCLIKVPEHKSKRYWINGYDPAAPSPPDCWSNDSVRPHPSILPPPQPAHWRFQQPNLCAECNWNQFGTSTRSDGKPGKGKACGDYKRAVVRLYYPPMPDGFDAAEGALMLLQIPADSLQAIKKYGEELSKKRVYAISVVTYVGMLDAPGISWPKLTFRDGPALQDDEAAYVKQARKSTDASRILAEEIALIDYSEAVTNGDGEEEAGEPEAPKAAAPTQSVGIKPTPPQAQPTQHVQTSAPSLPRPPQAGVNRVAPPPPPAQQPTQQQTARAQLQPQVQQQAARAAPTAPPRPNINTALNRPAPPPPSARAVRTPPPPPPPRQVMASQQEVVEEDEEDGAEYGQGGAIEDELDRNFSQLPQGK